MNILFIASEGAPFIKTGGLGDVIGALPKELNRQGAHVRVMLPKYEGIPEALKKAMKTVKTFTVSLGWRNQYCGIQELEHAGIRYYFIDNEYYFKRQGLYGYDDDAERFVFFGKAALEALPHLGFLPDLLHCHDWQTGLMPFYLRTAYSGHPFYESMKTMFTIHNLKYQGLIAREHLIELSDMQGSHFDAIEYYGHASCLKAGVVYSDILTTVSPTYAGEIQTAEYGEGLDGLLRANAGKLYGIVNGIDDESYDPLHDAQLHTPYRDSPDKKRQNKTALQLQTGLTVNEHIPLIGIVSRLVQQKGFDLIRDKLQEMLQLQLQLAILGTGEFEYEQFFRYMAQRYPQQIFVRTAFDDALARKIYAASDLFLMPSLFEPCGIGQLLALRYRAVPIVRETGGLKDTVQAFNEFSGEGNGFSFTHPNADDMLHAIQYAIEMYRDQQRWSLILNNIAKSDFSWKKSARQYIELYGKLLVHL